MPKEEDYSPEEWTLLGLAGAFNTEKARWNIRKGNACWEITRETDEAYPEDVEVKASFPTNGEAHRQMSVMEDIAAAKAFLARLNKALDEDDSNG